MSAEITPTSDSLRTHKQSARKYTLKEIIENCVENIYTLIYKTDIAAARFMCALSALVFGCLLLLPGTTLEYDEYAVFINILSKEKWAVVYVSVGFLNMYTLIARIQPGWYTPVLAFIQMIVWVVTTASLAVPWLNGIHRLSAEGVVAWMAIWIMIRTHDGSEGDIHDHDPYYADRENRRLKIVITED